MPSSSTAICLPLAHSMLAVPPVVPPRHFAAPALGLAMVSRQTLGGKADFSSQKSHLEHSSWCHGGGTKVTPEHRGLAAARDCPRPHCSGSGLGTHSATPLSGTSTLRHAITVKSGVFCSPERCCETGTTSGCIPCGGVQPCLVCGRNTLALNPQPEQNLFLALPYLPSVLPFF